MKQLLVITLSLLVIATSHAQDNTTPKELVATKDTLLIKRGDKLLFEASLNEAQNLVFTQVLTITDSAKTVRIELDFSDGLGAMLKIFNPFKQQLVYKAELYNYKKREFVETSTIPVYPGISSFETWPYKIEIIQLSGFKLSGGR